MELAVHLVLYPALDFHRTKINFAPGGKYPPADESVTVNLLEIKLTESQRESHRRGVSSLVF